MTYKKQKRKRRKQIGRGRGKKLVKALVKNVGLPLLYKSGRRNFNLPTGIKLNIKKNGNSYGLHGHKDLWLTPWHKKRFGKQVL